MENTKSINNIRWVARIIGILLIIFCLTFFIGNRVDSQNPLETYNIIVFCHYFSFLWFLQAYIYYTGCVDNRSKFFEPRQITIGRTIGHSQINDWIKPESNPI